MFLSNTNEWHWHHARRNFPVLSLTEKTVLSYEIGVLKPDPLIYRTALSHASMGAPIVFVDDVTANVEAARKLGIKGIHFQSARQLRSELKKQGCVIA